MGVSVRSINMEHALKIVSSWIADSRPEFIICREPHGLIRCQKDDEIRILHGDTGLVTPGGMPLVWMMRQSGHTHVKRVNIVDLMFAPVGEHGYRELFYRGTPGIPERIIAFLKSKFPNIHVARIYLPLFRSLTLE